MADEVQPVDWWGVLEEAEQTVEQWPEWQRGYEVDATKGDVVAAAGDYDVEASGGRAHGPGPR